MNMAMPMDYDSMRTGDDSERTDNVTDYKRTCIDFIEDISCLLYTSPSPRDGLLSRMPSSA